MTADSGDRALRRFVSHVVAAVAPFAPDCGDAMLEVWQRPQPIEPAELGAVLADELLDLANDVVLVIDDYHLAASVHVERFLGGLLQARIPRFHLLLSTRNDPALPLARMRLLGEVVELRAADLRFSDEETQALLGTVGRSDADLSLVEALQRQTGGWIAGMRLVTLALPADGAAVRLPDVVARDRHLMDFLVEEVLAAQPATIQDFLLRMSIVDRTCASLADALVDAAPDEGSRTLLERLAHDSLFFERERDRGTWYRYHPLFRSLLRHQLEARTSAEDRAAMHLRASAWYAEHGLLDLAIRHRLAAGDEEGAGSLIEDHVHIALDREDWNTLAGWLDRLPEAVVSRSPPLLLAKGWVSHFSGRAVPITTMLAQLNALLATIDADATAIAAWEAERDTLRTAALALADRDPQEAVESARRAVAHVPSRHRLAEGLASFGLGCALQAAGRTDEAIRFLTHVAERSEDRIDAGSIRALGGLMFVHRQAGNRRACADVAQHVLTLAQRRDLPVAAGWARWILGWLAYDRDELEAATSHFTAIVADHHRVHLHTACEAMFGLTLAYQACGKTVEAAGTLRRLLEIILDANALEYLPLFRGYEARLALMKDDAPSAVAWLTMDIVDINSTSLDSFDHPFLTRIKVLLAEGSPASLDQAGRDLERFRRYAESRHHGAHRIEVLALTALVRDTQGHEESALAMLQHSIALAADTGVLRTYLELGPSLGALLRRLARRVPEMIHIHRLLEAIDGPGPGGAPGLDHAPPSEAPPMLEVLTLREAEVLACLGRRLSYLEIGEELFISPQTVKSHVASIYGKLGVGNRRQALVKAQAHGWLATEPPLPGDG